MLKTIDLESLALVTGGSGLLGDNSQTINTNWGGTMNNTTVINEAPKPPTSVVEYVRLHPELRIGGSRPVGGFGPMIGGRK